MFNQLLNISNYYFNPYAIPVMVVGMLILSIGLFVLKQNKRSIINIAFFFQCFSVALWTLPISLVYLSRAPETALIWYRYFTFFGVVNIMPSLILLAIAWTGKFNQKKLFVFANYLIAFVFYILAVSTNKVVVPHAMQNYFWGFYPTYGTWARAFLGLYATQFIIGITILYRAYKREDLPVKKIQIGTMITATLVASAATADFIPKFFHVPLYPYGYIPIFIYVSLVAYSIVRYRTFDIETAIHKTAMWLLTFSFILVPILALERMLAPYIRKSDFAQIGFCVFSSLTLAFYLRVIQPKIDHCFQRRQSNLEEISSRFTDDLVHLKGLNQLIQRIEDAIADTLYPQKIDIFIYSEKERTYKLVNTINRPRETLELNSEDRFLQWLSENDKIVHKDFIDIDPAYAKIKEAAKSYSDRTEAIVVIPLVLNENLLGVVNLGKKSNLRRYTGPEFQFLTKLKNQSTIAISNSLLYETMEEQVRQRTKELLDVQKQLIQAEKMATMGTLAGGVAHEINNPLTAILTNTQMLLASNVADDKLDKESLELIEEATKRCRTIVQKLMAYARKPLETSEISKVNLLNALNDVISFIGYQLEQDNIKIATNAKKGTYMVMGNSNEIEQVITNLILNAKDAIRRIKRGGTINVTFSESGDWIKIEIEDEGAGIPKEVASKIFDPFFTTKDVGRGVGLGLSICQAIIEKHNGTISFKSALNKGTTFTIQLPIAEKQAVLS